MTNLYKNLEVQFNKVFRHLKTGNNDKTYLIMKWLQCFIAYCKDDVTRIYLSGGDENV